MVVHRTQHLTGLWESGDETSFDVVVVGSGCAGLTAALWAATAGARVLVAEKTSVVGGTSAMSGAGTWVPVNQHANRAGIHDSIDLACEYMAAAAPAEWRTDELARWRSFVEHSGPMLAFVEGHTAVRFELLEEPDPMAEMPGGLKSGRMLAPLPYSMRRLGRWATRVRSTTLPHIFTYKEVITKPIFTKPMSTVLRMAPELARRWLLRERAQGSALIGGLLEGCLKAGCTFALNARATSLLSQRDGRVAGVQVHVQGDRVEFGARSGVILATGGFEWDDITFQSNFPGANGFRGSPRSNTGDGQRMALQVGADLQRMDQANIFPCIPTEYEGQPHGMPMTFQAAPHAIVINRHGQRFANEYDCNFGEALDRRDVAGQPINLPAWLIADSRYLKRATVLKWYLARDRDWVLHSTTLEGLARKIGAPSEALTNTVSRYNGYCADNYDRDFHRGESVWDRFKSRRADGYINTALGSIERAPFIAIPLNRSVLGTKGGAMTDASGRVLRPDGSAITGLYCAGNAMANPIGTRSPGSGTTIGPCMTWGFICAQTALGSGGGCAAVESGL